MARLIQKSGYFKGGSTGYMKYIAQRDGVEITSDTGLVTEKQRQLIEDLLKDYGAEPHAAGVCCVYECL